MRMVSCSVVTVLAGAICWSVHRLISPLKQCLDDGGICEGFHCNFGSDGIWKYYNLRRSKICSSLTKKSEHLVCHRWHLSKVVYLGPSSRWLLPYGFRELQLGQWRVSCLLEISQIICGIIKEGEICLCLVFESCRRHSSVDDLCHLNHCWRR